MRGGRNHRFDCTSIPLNISAREPLSRLGEPYFKTVKWQKKFILVQLQINQPTDILAYLINTVPRYFHHCSAHFFRLEPASRISVFFDWAVNFPGGGDSQRKQNGCARRNFQILKTQLEFLTSKGSHREVSRHLLAGVLSRKNMTGLCVIACYVRIGIPKERKNFQATPTKQNLGIS